MVPTSGQQTWLGRQLFGGSRVIVNQMPRRNWSVPVEVAHTRFPWDPMEHTQTGKLWHGTLGPALGKAAICFLFPSLLSVCLQFPAWLPECTCWDSGSQPVGRDPKGIE